MTVELSEHTIETYDDFTVAGVAHRGADVDAAELWAALDDFEFAAHSDERYGVLYDFDGEEFTYVAGVGVESADDLPRELTVVEIPEGRYAVFPMRGMELDDVVGELDDGVFADSDRRRGEGAVVQRYDVDADPRSPDVASELIVPVEGE